MSSAAIETLRPLGKPILPVGQAYDPAIDGSEPVGPPSAEQIDSFIRTAAAQGASGVSFWVWSTATRDHWTAIARSKEFASG